MMGTVVAFRRSRSRRPAAVTPVRQTAKMRWGWWGVGALSACVAAVLSPLRWPARAVLIALGSVGVLGALACLALSDPTNWSMVSKCVVVFVGSVALWHGGEAALNGARALSVYGFGRAKPQKTPPDQAE